MKTIDRGRFYTTGDIGEKRSTTPEGFLVCHDVPIARTGQQLYLSSEVPVEDAGNGEVRIDRPPSEVFRPETIASFEGKAVTVEHPNDFVTPDNWQQLAIGTVQNVRQGDGMQDDLLIADLVITDASAIKYVNESLPEVSAGYEARYEQTEPGRGVQRDIVGNHVALVERGRAGPRCSIQDRKPTMKPTLWERLMTAVKAQDAAAVKAEMETMDADTVATNDAVAIAKLQVTVDAAVASVTALTKVVQDLSAKVQDAGTGNLSATPNNITDDDDDKDDDDDTGGEMTGDDVLEAEQLAGNAQAVGKVLSGDSLKQLIARAEIIAPGSAIKTADSKKADRKEAMAFMRSTLEKAHATADGRKAIEPFLAGREIKKLSADSLAAAFIGAAELMRIQNNARSGMSASKTKDFGRATSVDDINARNREFWAARK